MSNYNGTAIHRASIEYLDALSQLLESDPDTLAAMSPRQVEQGLRMMDLCPKRELPDEIKLLVEANRRSKSRRPKARFGLRPVIAAVGMLIILGFVKTFRTRAGWLTCLCGILIGAAVAGTTTFRVYGKKMATSENTWAVERAAIESELNSVRNRMEAQRYYYEKVKGKWQYLSAAYVDVMQKIRIKNRTRNGGLPRKGSPNEVYIDTVAAQLLEAATPFAKLPNVDNASSTPSGLPAAGTIEQIKPNKHSNQGPDENPTGVKISVESCAPISATADGIVIAGISIPRYGKSITVSHANGLTTTYGPLSESLVSSGERVGFGQKIGSAAFSTKGTPVSLRYQVYKNNQPDNVLSYIGKNSQ
jgi:murein DD-endopeptidase MepM/ murein hydrolase activator NlpD